MFISIICGLLAFGGYRVRSKSSWSCEAPDIFVHEDPENPMRLSRVLESAAPYDGDLTDDFINSAENVKRIKRVLPLDKFNYVFYRANQGLGPDKKNGPYYYENFLKAAAKWPKFCDEVGPTSRYSDADKLCELELASMFAHFAQEVGEHAPGSDQWRQGLYWYAEMGCEDAAPPACSYTGGTCDSSTWQGQAWPCAEGERYYGRGAKQLSYNFNYGPFSEVVFGDVTVLLNDPDKVITDGWLAFASAVWFYMTPQSPKPSMHDVVVGYWTPNDNDIAGNRLVGFGVLIMIINGGIECGGTVEVAQAANRIDYYKNFCTEFNITPGDNLSCKNMQEFDAKSNGAINAYWEQSWSEDCACQQVSYQTAYNIFSLPQDLDGPYCQCVEHYFDTDTCSGSSGDTIPCNIDNCSSCVAINGNPQAVTDEDCKQCPSYEWWPCNVDGLCQCISDNTTSNAFSTTNSIHSSMTSYSKISTSMTTTTVSSSTTTPIPSDNIPCTADNCDSCEAVPNNGRGATDEYCSACPSYQWWPCGDNTLCRCPFKNSTVTSTHPGTGSHTMSSTTVSPPITTTSTSVSTTSGNILSTTTTENPSCVAPDIFAHEDPKNPMRLSRVLDSTAPYSGELTDDFIDNAENVKRIKRVLPLEKFNYVFYRANKGLGPDKKNGPYYYENFLKAAAKWPKFCAEVGPRARYTDSDDICKLELASMFAHFAQEVGEHAPGSDQWRQGLYWYTEVGCEEAAYPACSYRGGTCDSSTWQGQAWPCPEGERYYGRGAKQLSYNFNYGPFSEVVFGDVTVLLNDPDKVITDGWLAFASAFWFYMTPQSPKPSMHDVVVGYWTPNDNDIAGNRLVGFGVLIMIINGGIECGGSVEVAQAANRIDYYKNFCNEFNITPGDNLSCKNMQAFDANSNGAIKSYWDQSWSGLNECQQVSYQTAYDILAEPKNISGPYCDCVDKYFGS